MKNSMVVFKKGDRFGNSSIIVECLVDHTKRDIYEFYTKNYHIVIDSQISYYKKGDTNIWPIDLFEYLGNFDKSDNFTTLYDKLNESTD